MTMTFRKIAGNVLVDPTYEESNSEEARITFEVSKPEDQEVINAMQKGGSASFTQEELTKMIEESKNIFQHLHKIAEEAISKE